MTAPDRNPLYGRVLADYLAAHDTYVERADTSRRFRFSDAGSCGRAIALSALEVEQSNPMTASGLWVTGLGTFGHTVIQSALAERFGDAVVLEVDAIPEGFDGSGHADAMHERVCVEVKNTGAFAFDKAIGLNRKARKWTDPQGPRASARIQGALNALALGAESLCIVYLAMEAVSDSLAEQLGMEELDRFYAQWTYPREEWLPWALHEQRRIGAVLDTLDEGNLPAREAVGDDMRPERLTIGRSWRCSASYCRHFATCVGLDDGVVPVPVQLRKAA